MRRKFLAVTLGALFAGGMLPAQATQSHVTYVTRNCLSAKVKPKEIVFACADAGFRVEVRRWPGWHLHWARGHGTALINDCKPACVSGTLRHRRATVTLRHRRWCPRFDAFVFKLAKIRLRRPVNGRRNYRYTLMCPPHGVDRGNV